MKKLMIIYLIIIAFVFAGCSLPTKVKESKDLEQEKMVKENSTKDMNLNDKTDETQKSLKKNDIDLIAVTFFYQDKDGVLIPITKKVPKKIGIAKLAVEGLIDNSILREGISYYGLYPVLPEGTKVLGVNIKEGNCIIDFNDKILDYNESSIEQKIFLSLVYTLTEFKTINNVYIRVNGKALDELKYNGDISKGLNRKNLLINDDNFMIQNGRTKFDLYFLRRENDKFSYLTPVSKEYQNNEDSEETVNQFIIDLFSYENNNKFYSELPQGIKILSTTIDDGVLALNLSKEILNYSAKLKEEKMIEQILFSINEINNVKKVSILIEGNKINLNEGNTFVLPKDINLIN